MDFVVAGFGGGAILMLLGFAVRDLGPLRYRSVEHLTPVHDEWLAMCRSVGTVLVVAGLVVCLATLVSLLVGVGDKNGSRSVMAIVAIAVIGCGVWSVLAIRRFVAMQTEFSDRAFESYGAFSAETSLRPQPRTWRRVNRPQVGEAVGGDVVGAGSDLDLDTSSDVDDRVSEAESAVVSSPQTVAAPEVTVSEPVAPATQESGVEQPPSTEVQPQIADAATTPPPSRDASSDGEPEQRFSSRVLADVEDERTEPTEGFRSTLLAGLEGERTTNSERGFSSSILADLGRSTNGSADDEQEQKQEPVARDEDDTGDRDSEAETTVTTTHEPDGNDEVSASQRSSTSGTEF